MPHPLTPIRRLIRQAHMRERPASTHVGPDPLMRRQRYERVPVHIPVRVVSDSPNGIRTVNGELLGMTETDCAVRVYAKVEPNLAGRLDIEANEQTVRLVVRARWTQPQSHGWTLGVDFDHPNAEKRDTIGRLLGQQAVRRPRSAMLATW